MKATWKKVWRADGSSEEWPEGKRPEIQMLTLTPPRREVPDMLTDRRTAERLIALNPEIFSFVK